MFIFLKLEKAHFLEFLFFSGSGGVGGVSPSYSTIVPLTFRIPNGSTGFKKFPQIQA